MPFVVELKTVQCSDGKDTFWARRSEVFVSFGSYNSEKTLNSTNDTDCIDLCNGCHAVEYHMKTKKCWVYDSSGIANFRRVTETSDTITYQRMCLNGKRCSYISN